MVFGVIGSSGHGFEPHSAVVVVAFELGRRGRIGDRDEGFPSRRLPSLKLPGCGLRRNFEEGCHENSPNSPKGSSLFYTDGFCDRVAYKIASNAAWNSSYFFTPTKVLLNSPALKNITAGMLRISKRLAIAL
jgi:hypothetical protein